MIRIVVREPDGNTRTVEFARPEVTIGRVPANDLMLPYANVSKHHARLERAGDGLLLQDLHSTNGTFVNGSRVAAPLLLKADDAVTIGDCALAFADEAPAVAAPAQLAAAPEPAPVPPTLPPGSAESERIAELRKSVHEKLLAALDLRRLDVERLGDAELRARVERSTRDIVSALVSAGELAPGAAAEQLVAEVLDEALGFGPLEKLLADDAVSEIMVNGCDRLYVERDGRLARVDRRFSSNAAVLAVIERIVGQVGRRIDESSPLVDARLKDGSRVNAIIPPLSLCGPCLTIRKFRRERLRVQDLVRFGTLDERIAAFLAVCVRARKNVLISGGTGSGKTTTLNVLSNFIPAGERIVTIEDAAELQLEQEHWVQLEARPPNLEGRGQITIRDLVKNALRMRPDRIVVGECRSGEALDMLQAMNTGHDGSLTTLHANSPRDALARLETMVLMAGMDLPLRAVREQIVSAVDVLVQQTRFGDGSRRVTHVSEVVGLEGEVVTLQDIFRFEQRGLDAAGRVQGAFRATGFVPTFYEELRNRGVAVDLSPFREAAAEESA